MHSVDVLEEALELAAKSGFEVRREWLGEATGGACRLGNKWILFVDLSLPADEQLAQVVGGLQNRDWVQVDASHSRPLRRLLGQA